MNPCLIYAMNHKVAEHFAIEQGMGHKDWCYVRSADVIQGSERGSTLYLVGNYLQSSDAHKIMMLAITRDLIIKKVP